MPSTLSCTISKIGKIPNKLNADIITEYRAYIRDRNPQSIPIAGLEYLFTAYSY
jgi:hypothetical protein